MKHEFAGLTFDHVFVPFLRLRCVNCGMKAYASAAVQLEGLPCR